MSGEAAPKHEEEENTPSTAATVRAAQASIDAITTSIAELEEELKQAKAELKKWSARVENPSYANPAFAIERETFYQSQVKDAQAALLEEKKLLLEEKKLAGTLPQKKKTLTKLGDDYTQGDVAGFVLHEMKRPRITPPPQEQFQVQELRGHLFGDEKAPNKILLRPVYAVFTKLVKESFQKREQKVVIAGSRGIGKSVFGWLMVLEFVMENKIVLYNHRDVMLLVLDETPNAAALQEVNQRMTMKGFAAIGAEKGVYKFGVDEAYLFNELCTLDLVQLVLDLGDGSIGIPRDGNAPKLILSSPNADKLKALERHLKTVFYMPVWSWEELEAAHEADLGVSGESKEILMEAFKVFGGIARTLLQTPKKQREADLKRELNQIMPQQLTNIFESMAYHSMPASSGILIHVFPENDAFDDYRCDFASKEMCLQLLVKFHLDGRCTVEKFAADVAGKSSLAAWSGLIFEPMAHAKLVKGCKLQLRDLNTTSSSLTDFTVPPLSQEVFSSLAALSSIKVNTLYIPSNTSFETIDSFMVLKAGVFPINLCGGKTHVLVMLQMTISNRHSVSYNGLDEVSKEVKKTFPDIHRVLAFGTVENGIRTYQKPTNVDKTPTNRPLLEYSFIMETNLETNMKVLKTRVEEAGALHQ